jgi:hypothetical protein
VTGLTWWEVAKQILTVACHQSSLLQVERPWTIREIALRETCLSTPLTIANMWQLPWESLPQKFIISSRERANDGNAGELSN